MSEEQTNQGETREDPAKETTAENEQVSEPQPENSAAESADTEAGQAESVEPSANGRPSADQEPSAEDQVEQLKNQLVTAQEDVLRAQAEAQNARRRSEADVEKARKFALERFVGDLLPVIDNLDRALESIDTSDDALKSVVEGIELTRKSFLDTMAKNQVTQIDPAGEPFDPENHQAMSMVPNPDVEPNTVIDVFQKGYSLNGRLIRPAMVVVSKAAE